MEINEIENSGSLGLAEFVRPSSGKSVEVKLKDLKSNVALIIKDFIIMALRGESDWTIGCVDYGIKRGNRLDNWMCRIQTTCMN